MYFHCRSSSKYGDTNSNKYRRQILLLKITLLTFGYISFQSNLKYTCMFSFCKYGTILYIRFYKSFSPNSISLTSFFQVYILLVFTLYKFSQIFLLLLSMIMRMYHAVLKVLSLRVLVCTQKKPILAKFHRKGVHWKHWQLPGWRARWTNKAQNMENQCPLQ